MRREAIATAVLLALVACGRDVIVGYDLAGTGPSGPAGDGGIVTLDGATAFARSSLQAVALVPGTSTYRVGGFTGSAGAADATADAWWATIADGTIADEQRRDVGAGRADRVQAIAVAGSRTSIGGAVDVGGRRQGWVLRVEATGADAWTTTIAEPGGGDAEVTSIVEAPTQTAVAGIDRPPNGVEDGWMAALDPAGAVKWRSIFRTNDQAHDTRVNALALTDRGRIVGGGDRLAKDSSTLRVPTIIILDPDGALFNSATDLFGAGRSGTVRGVIAWGIRFAEAEIVACAGVGGEIHVVDTTDLFREIAPPRIFTEPEPLELGGCTRAGESIIVTGAVITPAGPVPWAAKLEHEGLAPVWTRRLDGSARPLAIAGAPDGTALAVGQGATPGTGWFARVGP